MSFAPSIRRALGLSLASASLFVVAGCSGDGGDAPAPPPSFTVNPVAAPANPGAATDAGPGSNAATDSTLNR